MTYITITKTILVNSLQVPAQDVPRMAEAGIVVGAINDVPALGEFFVLLGRWQYVYSRKILQVFSKFKLHLNKRALALETCSGKG